MPESLQEKDDVEVGSKVVDSPQPTSDRRQWTTTRWELWAFYVYYIVCASAVPLFHGTNDANNIQGNSGLSGFNFGPSQFQNLMYLAGYDPSQPPFTAACGGDSQCVLPFLGRVRDSEFPPVPTKILYSISRTVNSIVLLTNGISFALQAAVLLLIGSWADYGRWRYGTPS